MWAEYGGGKAVKGKDRREGTGAEPFGAASVWAPLIAREPLP